jgi:hypothetical protein
MSDTFSDNYDLEWGTASARQDIDDRLGVIYEIVNDVVLGRKPPIYIQDLVYMDNLSEEITATLTEQEWRLLRFALKRAQESL